MHNTRSTEADTPTRQIRNNISELRSRMDNLGKSELFSSYFDAPENEETKMGDNELLTPKNEQHIQQKQKEEEEELELGEIPSTQDFRFDKIASSRAVKMENLQSELNNALSERDTALLEKGKLESILSNQNLQIQSIQREILLKDEEIKRASVINSEEKKLQEEFRLLCQKMQKQLEEMARAVINAESNAEESKGESSFAKECLERARILIDKMEEGKSLSEQKELSIRDLVVELTSLEIHFSSCFQENQSLRKKVVTLTKQLEGLLFSFQFCVDNITLPKK
jgi:hypothetical protein